MKPRQIVRRRAFCLKTGPNVRSDLGDPEDLRRLGRSLKKRQDTPLLIDSLDTILDGYRRHAAALLEGVDELDCIVVDESLSTTQRTTLQLVSSVHRADLSAYDKAVAVRDIRAANPGMTGKQLAEEILDLDPSMVTKLLSLFDCVPEVIEAAKAGRIGVTDWYAISKNKGQDQLITLNLKLSGATRDQVEAATKKQQRTPATAARVSKIKCQLSSGTYVVVSGEEMTLDEMIEALAEASKEAKKAQAQGLDAKTFSAVMRDRAKAG